MNRVIDIFAVGGAPSAILAWVGQALILGTLLAGLTWLVVRVLHRRIPPTVETALWLIVLVKFLTPIGPASPFSMAGLIESASNYSTKTALSVAPIELPSMPLGSGSPGAESSAAASTAAPHSVNWTLIIAAIYLSGALAFLVYRIRTYRVMRRSCSELPNADATTTTLVADVCRRLGVARRPAVRLSDDVAAPFVIGLLKPMLVLSHRHLASPDELETVVVHEVAHLRRGDMLVRLLQWIAGSVLFFWPVVAWVNRRIDVAREHACDQWALRRGKLSAGEYARCLLEAVRPMPARRFAYQPVCMAANPKSIERRIDMILETNTRSSKRPLWNVLTGTLVLGWGAFVLCDAAAAGPQDSRAIERDAQATGDKAVQPSQSAREKDAPDPVTPALKAAVRNGSMDEQRARDIYTLLAKGVPGSSGNDKSKVYLEMTAQKLDTMVAAGKLSAEDAEDKMIALEKQMAAKAQAASRFEEELASRMQNDGMSKTEAYLDLAAEKLDEIVQTGELTAEDAQARLNAIEQGIEFGRALASKMENEGKTKSEAYFELTAEKLDAMVRAGEMSAEDAEDELIELEQQIADKQERASQKKSDDKSKAKAYLEQFAAELDAMVKAGKLSAEEAEAKLIAIEDSLAGKKKAGSLDARTVLRAVKRVELDADQKDEIRDIEQETIGVYRKISRKDKEGHTKLAEQVKAEITKLLDAEQKEQFEAALKRLDRGKVKRERKSRKP